MILLDIVIIAFLARVLYLYDELKEIIIKKNVDKRKKEDYNFEDLDDDDPLNPAGLC